jgi:hypothetical protein
MATPHSYPRKSFAGLIIWEMVSPETQQQASNGRGKHGGDGSEANQVQYPMWSGNPN